MCGDRLVMVLSHGPRGGAGGLGWRMQREIWEPKGCCGGREAADAGADRQSTLKLCWRGRLREGYTYTHTHTMKDELNNTSKHRRDDKGRNFVRHDMDERSFILAISTTAGVTSQHKNSRQHLDRMISRSDREQRGVESKSMRCFKQHTERMKRSARPISHHNMSNTGQGNT